MAAARRAISDRCRARFGMAVTPVPSMLSPAELDATGMIFAAEMYGVQLDLLASALGLTVTQASALVVRWRTAGHAEDGRLSPGPRWVWLTRAGLAAAGLPYRPGQPGLSRLTHLRAVAAARLALEATPHYQRASAYWRSERRLRHRIGGRAGLREHVPDAEVHWPDGGGADWDGECWAIEAELTPKTLPRTMEIMRELLTRTGDYGGGPTAIVTPGHPPRHARAVYLCSPSASRVVTRARTELGPLGARIEIRPLPAAAAFPPPPPPAGSAAAPANAQLVAARPTGRYQIPRGKER